MMKKRGRKSQNSQTKFRKKTFPFYQYWIVYFTEKYPSGEEKDFTTFIKAKSAELVRLIIKAKVDEDQSGTKTKAISVYMLHKDYINTVTNTTLSVEDWSNVRKSAFPNINNFLFKKENPRPEGYSNRFNKTDYKHLKKIGFRKGKDNWISKNRRHKIKSIHDRKGLIWSGAEWVAWDKEEMLKTKNKLVDSLIMYANNRSKAAEHLKIGRTKMYKLMCRCEEIEWWNTNFPPAKRVPPRVSAEQRSATQKKVMALRKLNGETDWFGNANDEIESKRLRNLKLSKAKERDEYRKSLIPKIRNALKENGNSRIKAAVFLNVKRGTLKAWMQRTKCWVDWNKEYPCNYIKNENINSK